MVRSQLPEEFFYGTQEGTPFFYLQRSNWLNDFLIDIIISNFT